jgi:hypothetical protein
VDLYVNDRGLIDEFMFQASVPLINYMQKNPEEFRSATFEGYGSCMDMLFALVGKIFENARAKEDEIEAICAVTLIIQMLESLQGIEGSLHNIIEFLVKELSGAKTPDYKCMLAQGLSMCLWYNTPLTLQSLEQLGCTSHYLQLLFSLVQGQVKQDFEIQRFVLGLSSLVQRGDPAELPATVQGELGNVMKALVFLCQRSIVVRLKAQEKAEQAEEDNVEGTGQAIYEDEENELAILSDDEDDEDDEDYDCAEDLDRDLYDSKLDSLDEVLFLRDVLGALEQQNPQLYQYYFLQCLDQNEQLNFHQAVQKALEYQQYI